MTCIAARFEPYCFVHLNSEGFAKPAASNLALDLRVTGNFGEALDLSEEVPDACAEAPGPDYPSALAAASNLALDLRVTGNFGEALDLSEEVPDACAEAPGPDYPSAVAQRTPRL